MTDNLCSDIHAAVAADDVERREALRARGPLAVWQTNGPRRPDVERDLIESAVTVMGGTE